jgi:predicted MPP superfamily phosphohydrolase
VSQSIEERLERRLGRLHARLRLGIEADHEAQVFGHGINYFHIENLPPSHIAIRLCLKAAGLYGRGQRNATKIELRQHEVISARLPEAFDGFTLLQLSDFHVEMSEGAMTRLAAMLPDINYDLCVLTGDYRAETFGAYEPALAGMEKICSILKRPIYGVLGADFSLLLGGHTHGGQICLPGRIPITLDSVLPRHMGSGSWKYRDMVGYTSAGAGSSIVPARFNCPPEITLHRLRRQNGTV